MLSPAGGDGLPTYINYQARGGWAGQNRRVFLDYYWCLAARDRRWTPPYYPLLARALNPAANPHLARLEQYTVALEATRLSERPRGVRAGQPATMAMPLEAPVAAAAILVDGRGAGSPARLALFQCINHDETWQRLLAHLGDVLKAKGCTRLVGPTGLSPNAGGLLVDHWQEAPPGHSAYCPPYQPELIAASGRLKGRLRLYHLAVGETANRPVDGPARLAPLDPQALDGRHLPLMQLAFRPLSAAADLPAQPDALEVQFICWWLGPADLSGWVAWMDNEPVGFVVGQPDLGPHLRRVRGGRDLLCRLAAVALLRRSARSGRILFGAVLPAWQGKGIGRQLLARARQEAWRQGWPSLAIGPVPEESGAAAFLEHCGAVARQTYEQYEWQL